LTPVVFSNESSRRGAHLYVNSTQRSVWCEGRGVGGTFASLISPRANPRPRNLAVSAPLPSNARRLSAARDDAADGSLPSQSSRLGDVNWFVRLADTLSAIVTWSGTLHSPVFA
jgi:hypothetical protein